MNTASRAEALARAAAHFPILGPCSADDLLEVVRLELGHPEILDGFRPYGANFARAYCLSPLLHIVSGNTPHAALQSLIRGLLVGAENRMKLPSEGLPEVGRFLSLLPAELRERVTISSTLPAEWQREAEAWIVFGSDETIAHFRMQARPGARFEPHGHLFSFGLVARPGPGAADAAARDISLFNQKGCLSPHDIYVRGDAAAFAAELARAMADFAAAEPPLPVSVAEAAEIHNVRANYRFRSASDPRVKLHESDGSLDWTVIYEDDPWFASSCLNRVVYVKPWPESDPAAALGPVRGWLGAVGIWPAAPEAAELVASLAPSRICPLGRMQLPPWSWHQEGRQNLAGLVRWVDFEADIG